MYIMQLETTKVFNFNSDEYKGGIATQFINQTEHRSNDVFIAYRLPHPNDDSETHVGCYPFGSRCLSVEKELFKLGAEEGEDVIIQRMW